VTPRRRSSASEPDPKLIERYAIAHRWNATKLRDVFFLAGPLTEDAQEKLACRLVRAFGKFQLLGENVQTIPFTATARRVEAVATNSRKALSALGINVRRWHRDDWDIIDNEVLADRLASWRLNAIYRVQRYRAQCDRTPDAEGEEALLPLAAARVDMTQRDDQVRRDAINSEAQRNDARVAEVVLGLIWLHRQAEAAKAALDARPKARRGGAANPITADGLLIAEAIQIFDDIQAEFSEANRGVASYKRQAGLGGPLVRFVQSVADLFDASLSDKQIADVWRGRLRRKQKPKKTSLP
jgi:hypothetical protein